MDHIERCTATFKNGCSIGFKQSFTKNFNTARNSIISNNTTTATVI